jgi:hypothetical protein
MAVFMTMAADKHANVSSFPVKATPSNEGDGNCFIFRSFQQHDSPRQVQHASVLPNPQQHQIQHQTPLLLQYQYQCNQHHFGNNQQHHQLHINHQRQNFALINISRPQYQGPIQDMRLTGPAHLQNFSASKVLQTPECQISTASTTGRQVSGVNSSTVYFLGQTRGMYFFNIWAMY